MGKQGIRFLAWVGVLSASLLISVVSFAHDGGVSDGGGDNISFADGAAWFMGAGKTIKACVEISPKFGHAPKELEILVGQAFENWRQYMDRKKIYTEFFSQLDRPATQIQFLPRCDQADLTLYFGVNAPEVKAAKERFFNPSAMAVRTSFDEMKRWGRGFIWLADPKSLTSPDNPYWHFPDWDKPNNLLSILMHELGHVMGNGHVGGTIMTEDVMQLINSNLPDKKIQIDQEHELVRCMMCQNEYRGEWSVEFKDLAAKVLKSIFGEMPDDEIPGEHSSMISLTVNWGSLPMPLTMTKGDRILRSELVVTSQQDMILSDKVFKTWGEWKTNHATIVYGLAQAKDGKSIPLVLEYNMNGQTPLTLVAIVNGIRVELASLTLVSP